MLPLNPFVVVADAAPSEPRGDDEQFVARVHADAVDQCRGARCQVRSRRGRRRVREPDRHVARDDRDPMDESLAEAPVWPFGLGFLLLAGAGAAVVSGRRLRTPIRRLPNGTRIA